jgi:hypothetical protein
MSHRVHAEIEYRREDETWVHSDICPPSCDLNNLDDKYRKYLHDCLDEWLNKSRSTGIFYITGETDAYLGQRGRGA